MDVITDKDRQKRQQEFDQEDIKNLLKRAKKGNLQTIILQSKFGFDADFSPYDWGTERGL